MHARNSPINVLTAQNPRLDFYLKIVVYAMMDFLIQEIRYVAVINIVYINTLVCD
jgi:hypothetical protein